MKKTNKRDIIMNFLFIIVVFFAIRKGTDRFMVAFLFSSIIILECVYKRKINFFDKKIIVSYSIYGIFLIISYMKNPFDTDAIPRMLISSFLFFICLSQLEINEKFYKKILFIMSVLSLISSYRGFREWKEYDFSSSYRIMKAGWATIYNIEIGVYIFISLFCIFSLKNIYLKILSGMIFLFSCFVVIGTHSRTIFLLIPFLVLITFISFLVKNKKLNYKGLIFFFIILYLFCNISQVKQHTQRLSTLTSIEKIKEEARIKILIQGIEDFKNNNYKPLGYYHYYNHFTKEGIMKGMPHLHNNILEILVTQGKIAVISYILFQLFLFSALLKRSKESLIVEQKYIVYLAKILFVFINLAGIVDSNIYFFKVNLLVSIIYGLSFCKVIPEKLK